MNKKLLNFITTIALALILSIFLPWWSVMLAAFITSLLFSLKSFNVFFIPFLAILLFWIAHTFILSSMNDFILAKKIALLFPLKGNPYFLIIITGIIGGFASGIAGVFGKQCANLLKK